MGSHGFCCSLILVLFFLFCRFPGILNYLEPYLNISGTAWIAAFPERYSIPVGNQDLSVWLPSTLDHRLVIAYSTNNAMDSNNHKLLFYGQDWNDTFCNFGCPDCIHYPRSFAPVRLIFKQYKVKRTKRPCAYYSNTCATFHCTLEGDLVFKLNPGPVNNSDHSIPSYYSLRRRAPSNTRVDRSRIPSNLTVVHRLPFNNVSRRISVVAPRRINDFSTSSSRTRNLNNLRSIKRYCGPSSQDANYLRFCTINTQSLNNKAAEFTDFICDYKPDVVAITETWFHVNESAARVMCTPAGYNLLDHPRAGRRGGGTGIMFRENLSVCQYTAGEFQSFEYSEWKITSGTQRIHLIIIHRPPYSEAHPTTTSVFLAEFSQYLESAVLCTDQLLISGDFNIHVDVTDDIDASRFRGLLDSIGLDQHVKVSTHISGHTLDLIITRNSDQLLISASWADHLFSDHMPVN